jgi:hypothetical protein
MRVLEEPRLGPRRQRWRAANDGGGGCGSGDDGGERRQRRQRRRAAAACGGGVRRRRREVDEERQWPRASCEDWSDPKTLFVFVSHKHKFVFVFVKDVATSVFHVVFPPRRQCGMFLGPL